MTTKQLSKLSFITKHLCRNRHRCHTVPSREFDFYCENLSNMNQKQYQFGRTARLLLLLVIHDRAASRVQRVAELLVLLKALRYQLRELVVHVQDAIDKRGGELNKNTC